MNNFVVPMDNEMLWFMNDFSLPLSEPSIATLVKPDKAAKQQEWLKKHRRKKREEKEELLRVVVELEDKLLELQQHKALQNILKPPSKWQRLAVNEARLKSQAIAENNQLKSLVKEKEVTAKALSGILQKTWQQSKAMLYVNNTKEKWKQLVLVKDANFRELAMHQIVDREFAKIDSAFVEAGLMDVASDVRKYLTKNVQNNTIEFTTILHGHKNLPLELVIQAAWKMVRGDTWLDIKKQLSVEKHLDTEASYSTSPLNHPLGHFQRRIICKKYIHPAERDKRCIIVCRSVVDDELFPYEENLPYANEIFWLLLERKANVTTMKLYHKIQPSVCNPAITTSSFWCTRMKEHLESLRQTFTQHTKLHPTALST